MMRQSSIAAVVERDLLRAADVRPDAAIECFSCGRSMMYHGNRFCSERCRAWFDAGNPSFTDQREYSARIGRAPGPWRVIAGPPGAELPYMPKHMRRGPVGFYVQCAGCQKEFESKGLRCCSTECERHYREREDNLAVMREVGIEPAAKRRCAECGTVIPRWTAGRRTPSTKRFCSGKCAAKSRRRPVHQESAECRRERAENPRQIVTSS